jgi:hypothetical protein
MMPHLLTVASFTRMLGTADRASQLDEPACAIDCVDVDRVRSAEGQTPTSVSLRADPSIEISTAAVNVFGRD